MTPNRMIPDRASTRHVAQTPGVPLLGAGRRLRRTASQRALLTVFLAGQALLAPSIAAAAAPAPPPAAAEALTAVYSALSCACFEGSELKIDKTKDLSPASCPCPYAVDVRKDLAAAIAQMPPQARGDRVQVALALERNFLTRSPEYERMLRYDAKQYAWFLQNVRCTCAGCKATVYFSNCQLTCTPAVIYKRRARIWLAMGFSTETLITYYLNEYNITHSAREQIRREWLLPKRQKRRGWMVPALLISGMILGLGLLLRRTVRRSAERHELETYTPTKPSGADGAPQDEPGVAADRTEASSPTAEPGTAASGTTVAALSAADRDRVLDALDDMEQDGGW